MGQSHPGAADSTNLVVASIGVTVQSSDRGSVLAQTKLIQPMLKNVSDCSPVAHLPLVFVVALLASGPASGEVFVLNQGGRVVGELLNPDEVPRKTFEIRTADGIVVTLDRSQVKERIHQRPEEVEYDKIRPRYPDTEQGQWELSEWCRERMLMPQREKHLTRVLELSPDHEKARRALGFSKSGGKWTTREDKMTAQGYVWHGGKWRLPQEVELIEAETESDEAQGRWQQDIRRWRKWLDTDKVAMARKEFLAIKDPYAVKPLAQALHDEPNPKVRLLLVDTLARIGTPQAIRFLSVWALEDPDEDVGLTCLDHLKGHKDPVTYFVSRLGSSNNDEINRAAFALEQMEDPTAIRSLIEVLVTSHKRKITVGGGQSATFGDGGGGLTMGSKTKVIERVVQNTAVLKALVGLAGGPNFGYSIPAWKSWYRAQRKVTRLDGRRD